jgi:hypothetical protein
MNRRSITAVLALLAVLVLSALAAGCGGDATTSTVTATETVPATSTTSSTSTTSTEETTTEESTTTEGGGGTPPPDQQVTSLTGFTSPSGNIGCIIDRKSVRCDVQKRQWDPPARPDSCNENVDYGQGISLSAGGAPEFVCAGDTTLGSGPALAYGESIGAGLLRCDSAESGMTCRDVETGRGFTISIEAYKLF